eukprot:6118858-Pleurochrysis_carterae.AAC.2
MRRFARENSALVFFYGARGAAKGLTTCAATCVRVAARASRGLRSCARAASGLRVRPSGAGCGLRDADSGKGAGFGRQARHSYGARTDCAEAEDERASPAQQQHRHRSLHLREVTRYHQPAAARGWALFRSAF